MALQRAVFLVETHQYKKLIDIAEREHVSVAEIGRRAIEAYDPELAAFEASGEELRYLADRVIEVTTETTQKVEEVRKLTQETLAQLRARRGEG